MTQVTIPSLPEQPHWHGGAPVSWSFSENVLTITAGAKTDWFLDPDGAINILNAPAYLFNVDQPCMLKARVSAEHASTYDAGVLTVYQDDQTWAKLCLELSPQGQVMVVSVVTKGASDDCNSVPITESSVYFRVAKLDKAFAFHYSLDGQFWNLVRYFTLGGQKQSALGFIAQSPTGQSCTATFSEIVYLPQKLGNVRTGE
ncbi:MAG TPA: DUF1349 domain-containing protein [Phototrophicaceae bacterium]|nr:DUF1349 domain-containing protein [Phototrophicaceae bacterium]